jgi:hypothetical protein
LTSLKNILKKADYYLVFGDEVIRSIFIKRPDNNNDLQYDSDYQSVIRLLKNLERIRLLPTYYKIKVYCVSYLVKVLKLINLYNVVRSLYHRVLFPIKS